MKQNNPIRQALISVSDKAGIVEFAQQLHTLGIHILSTGGTAQLLRNNNIPVTDVSEHTEFPEIMAGRVKTLHPKIHGGILARRGTDDAVMQQHEISGIDLVVVNLYPFEATVADPECDLATAIENIDIGGPTMLRAAAKNHAHVGVVVDSDDYAAILEEISNNNGALSEITRLYLAKKAFAHTAKYDGAISNYLSAIDDAGQRESFPNNFNVQLHKRQTLRYGENPHQKAAFYVNSTFAPASIASAQQIQGKALSFNNIADADAALECVKTFGDQPACVIVKHANPCGVATATNQLEAYQRAFITDKTSAFGGIIAFNDVLQATTAEAILNRQYVEVIIAPDVEESAKAILQTKPSIRVLSCGKWADIYNPGLDFKCINGGLLVQDRDNGTISLDDIETVSKRQPTQQELQDLLFAWKVVKFVKSNAIVYVKDQATIGIGAGQMSRVYSARIAGIKASDEGLEVPGSVMASDAFFPFRDAIDAAAKDGITAIIQPGGSIRDEEVIAAADEANIAMVFTRMRHFRH